MVSTGGTQERDASGELNGGCSIGRCFTFLVRSGFDAEQILDYPVDKIRLIARFAGEEAAADHLTLINGISLAIGAVVSKECGKHFERFMNTLEKDAGIRPKPISRPRPAGYRDQLSGSGQPKKD